jgi:hypothetical protein
MTSSNMCGACWLDEDAAPTAPNKTNNGEDAEATRGKTAADVTPPGNLTMNDDIVR